MPLAHMTSLCQSSSKVGDHEQTHTCWGAGFCRGSWDGLGSGLAPASASAWQLPSPSWTALCPRLPSASSRRPCASGPSPCRPATVCRRMPAPRARSWTTRAPGSALRRPSTCMTACSSNPPGSVGGDPTVPACIEVRDAPARRAGSTKFGSGVWTTLTRPAPGVRRVYQERRRVSLTGHDHDMGAKHAWSRPCRAWCSAGPSHVWVVISGKVRLICRGECLKHPVKFSGCGPDKWPRIRSWCESRFTSRGALSAADCGLARDTIRDCREGPACLDAHRPSPSLRRPPAIPGRVDRRNRCTLRPQARRRRRDPRRRCRRLPHLGGRTQERAGSTCCPAIRQLRSSSEYPRA